MNLYENTRSPGIIIARYESGESDLVLRIVTPDQGKITAIAKHSRKNSKRFSGVFDLLDRGSFELRQGSGEMFYVNGFIPAASFGTLRNDLEKMLCAVNLCEVADKIIPDHSSDNITYEIIELGLKAIDESQDTKEILRAVYASLCALTSTLGISDPDRTPSAKNLIKIFDLIEAHCNRGLNTRKDIQGIVAGLAR